jgi:hypothetical protein
MANMTITITVASNIGGSSFTWKRSAVIPDIQAAVVRNSQVQASNTASNEGVTGIGMQSYGGLGAVVAVTRGAGAMTYIGAADGSLSNICGLVFPAGVPCLMYGGAGTGFTGGVNETSTATDTPDEDIEAVSHATIVGNAVVNFLIGLKPIS